MIIELIFVLRKALKFYNTQCSFITSLYFKPEFVRSNQWKTPDRKNKDLIQLEKVMLFRCVSSDNESVSGRGGTASIIYTFGDEGQNIFTLTNGFRSSDDPPVLEVQPVGLAQESFRKEL